MFTLHEKCLNFVGNDLVNARMKRLIKDREASFREPFLANATDGQIKMFASENSIPYNGFSFYSLEYPGEIPDALRKANQKMNRLNDGAPRKKYLARRKKDAAAGKEKKK